MNGISNVLTSSDKQGGHDTKAKRNLGKELEDLIVMIDFFDSKGLFDSLDDSIHVC